MKKLNLEGFACISKKALTRNQQRVVMGGYGPGGGGSCLPRWAGCSIFKGDADCCPGSHCMLYNGQEQCV